MRGLGCVTAATTDAIKTIWINRRRIATLLRHCCATDVN
jgi:hypothetical protein